MQHGFCQGRSCLRRLRLGRRRLTIYVVDVVYLDYRKAFDTVWHSRLLTKRMGYGVDGQLLLWIKSFIQGRKMRVEVRGDHSDWVEVTLSLIHI